MTLASFSHVSDEELDWLEGAILIARDEYPALDARGERERLCHLARPLGSLRGLPLSEQIEALRAHLVEREGFFGNAHDYYDPRNSFINDVLSRRTGIPITLALVWVEVGRRAGMRLGGAAFPGHFLLRVEGDSSNSSLVDVFSAGAVLSRSELEAMLDRLSPGLRLDPEALMPARPRDILLRMLMNLRSIHAQRGDFARLLVVLSRLLELYPDSEDHWRDRGYLSARMGAFGAAASDFEEYLRRAPRAGDVAEVRRALDEVRGRSALAN